MRVCVRMCACARVRVCACARAAVRTLRLFLQLYTVDAVAYESIVVAFLSVLECDNYGRGGPCPGPSSPRPFFRAMWESWYENPHHVCCIDAAGANMR